MAVATSSPTVNRTRPLMDLAVYEATNHRSPEELRTRALALLERALQIDPKLVSIMRRAAVLEQVSAEWRIEQGQSPLAAFAATQAWLVRALQLAPRDRDAFISLASLHRARGEWRLSRKEPRKARAEFTAGLEAAERALQIDPRSSTAQKLRGKLMTLKPR